MEEPDINEAEDKKEADEKSELEFKAKQNKFFAYHMIAISIIIPIPAFWFLGNTWLAWVICVNIAITC